MARIPSRRGGTTAWRLGGAFLAILLLFAAALVVMLAALDRIAAAEDEVAALDHAKHAGHMAAAQVREQYIHQAHMLISFDTTHLDHYGEVVAATQSSTQHLEHLARSPEEQDRAREIARLARENDVAFRSSVLPAIERGDRTGLRELADRTEEVVVRVVRLNDELNAIFERQSMVARERAEALRGRAKTVTFLCFGLAIALAGVVGILLTRSIVRPISALRSGARRVGAGDLTARIEVPGKDEFAELAATFNQMTADLARDQAALVRSQKLASIGQVAAGIAHEINNPLCVILGHAKLLRRAASGDAADELRVIEDEAVQCQRIVQGLLDLARPQTLDLAPVDLVEVAAAAIARLDDAGQLEGKRVEAPTGAPARAQGDEGKLRQVISNIVLNAAQASPDGAPIAVETTHAGAEAVLSVTDRGPGIAADVLARIFDPFFTTKRTGTGLGLAIAQAIVDAHGGRIEIDSAVGRGTRVSVRLPAAPAGEGP